MNTDALCDLDLWLPELAIIVARLYHRSSGDVQSALDKENL